MSPRHLETENVCVELSYSCTDRHVISSHLVKDLVGEDGRVSVEFDWILGEMIARITRYVWAEELQELIQEVAYPASWWDHFRQDVLPAWLKERLPRLEPRYTTRTLTFMRKAVYPKFARATGEPYVIKETIEEES